MAITTNLLGKIDLNPAQVSQSGGPTDLSLWTIDVTIGAAGDYVTGTGLIDTQMAILRAAIGSGSIVAATGYTRDNTNTFKNHIVFFDPAVQRIRAFVASTGAEYAAGVAGDVFRLMIVAF